MALTRGRVIKAAAVPPRADDTRADVAAPSAVRSRRVAAAAVDDYVRANLALEAARAKADAIVERAREDAAAVTARAAEVAKQEAEAKLGAAWLALRAREEASAERDRDRAVTVAVALAERLVGAAIALDPGVVASLARQALAEARGARRVVVEACPSDVDALRSALASLPLPPEALELRVDPALARGDLRLHTDIGTLDAKLHPRLERLAAALRDALR